MQQRPPAEPGMPEADIDTPALLLDLDAFEANLDAMAAFVAPTRARLRAHAKTHKCPVIAHLQMARGAVGQCVQKVSEAEVMAWAGIPDILVSNEVASIRKLRRLTALSRLTRLAICADGPAQVALLEEAAEAAGTRLRVLVEIDVGAGRCGLAPGAEVTALAQSIARSPHLAFAGLQAYHGVAQHLPAIARNKAATMAADTTRDCVDALRKQGLACEIVGGAGTGTFQMDALSDVYTEVQAGSYAFMDGHYGGLDGRPPFRHALFVLATVMSAPRRGVAVVDAGHKAIAVDSGLPTVWGRDGIGFTGASDEHGTLKWTEATNAPDVGETLRLVPGHCDPTVDRYDWFVGVRNGRVECLWPVAARGAMS
jgi:D-serine deaminase-like pyridoxal phosphate-dependent protein